MCIIIITVYTIRMPLIKIIYKIAIHKIKGRKWKTLDGTLTTKDLFFWCDMLLSVYISLIFNSFYNIILDHKCTLI